MATQRKTRDSSYVLSTGIAAIVVLASSLYSQTANSPTSPEKDVLIFKDGEKLIGQFERSDGDTVKFKSDMAGEIIVTWDKIQELHSNQKFAVAEKELKMGRHEDTSGVPQGSLSMNGQSVSITSAPNMPPQNIPISRADHIVDEATFQRALERPGLFSDWKGAASFGLSLVLATQNNRSYTSAVTLSRSIPTESWLEPESRTTLNFSSAYGELTQVGEPSVKTSIYHADGERDEYFTDKLYAFAQAAFDHNFSQGLDLQQSYNGGIGWSVIKAGKEALDLKAAMGYLDQQFTEPNQNKMLIGSVFSETYDRTFVHRIVLHEQLSITPAWNVLRAYSATETVNLTLPVYKRVGVTLGSLDTFLNDPSPGFKKNSFQFTTSLTYTLP